MADVFSTTTSGLGSNLVTMAYDKLIEINLRNTPQFRAIADKKVGNPTHDGSSIRFQFHNNKQTQAPTYLEHLKKENRI